MIKYYISLLKKHASLLIMGLGAFGIFSTNVGLKSILSDHDYYNYSIIVTVLALLASFGALGLDQVFLRLASVKGKTISFDKNLIVLCLHSGMPVFAGKDGDAQSATSFEFLICFLQVRLLG